jgi:hypothetical protein
MNHRQLIKLIPGLLALTAALWLVPAPARADGPTLGGCPIFPADNIWNTPIDQLPVDANSSTYITTIGPTTRLHADFGAASGRSAPARKSASLT